MSKVPPRTIEATAIDEVRYQIVCEDGIHRELRGFFTFPVPGHEYMPAFRKGWWNGTICLYDLRYFTLPRGLLPYLEKFVAERSYSLTIQEGSKHLSVTEDQLLAFFKTLNASIKGNPMVLHTHQKDAVLHALNKERGVIISPTSSGKTAVLYTIIRFLQTKLDSDRKILVVVPSIGLVTQAEADFFDYSSLDPSWSCAKNVHKIMAGASKDTEKQIIVSTWQSIYKMDESWFQQFDAIFIDECHLAKAESLNGIGNKSTKAWFRLGLTGTLEDTKAHRLNIEAILGPAIQFVQTKNLMDRGIVADMTIDCLLLQYNDNDRKLVKDSTYADEVKWIVTNNDRNEFLVKLALSTKGNTLILFNYVENHGKPLYELLLSQAGSRPVHYISGETTPDEREAIRTCINDKSNAIMVCSVGTTAVGVSITDINNLVFASPTKSLYRTLQSIGRGLRVSAVKKTLKVFDIVDDLRWKSHENHVYRHFEERVRIYKKEKFVYRLLSMLLPTSSGDK